MAVLCGPVSALVSSLYFGLFLQRPSLALCREREQWTHRDMMRTIITNAILPCLSPEDDGAHPKNWFLSFSYHSCEAEREVTFLIRSFTAEWDKILCFLARDELRYWILPIAQMGTSWSSLELCPGREEAPLLAGPPEPARVSTARAEPVDTRQGATEVALACLQQPVLGWLWEPPCFQQLVHNLCIYLLLFIASALHRDLWQKDSSPGLDSP